MKDKKLFISIVSIFTIISFIIGVSYAYFVPIIIGNDTASSHHTKAGTLRLTYNGTNVLSLPNESTGDTTSTTFTVTNSGTLPVSSYEIYFSKLTNEFINEEIVYTLTCSSSDANPCLGKEQSPIPKLEELLLTQNSIEPGITHTYTLSVTFIEKDINQNYNQGKELKFTMTINEMEQDPAVLITRETDEYGLPLNDHFWKYAGDITEITFESQIDIPANAFKSWDVSETQNGKIMAYIIDDELGTNTYKLFIQSNKEIYANSNSRELFKSFYKLTTINNLNLLNTSNVTSMSFMFSDCYSLTGVDLSNFDTSKVINMIGMFFNCSGLTGVDLSNFDASNVTNMNSMFFWCISLTSVNLSNFNTSSVTDMSYMFYDCRSLTSLDLSNFDTSSVTSMTAMFEGCSGLTGVDLSNSIINNSIERCDIFYNCKSDLNIIVNDPNSKILYEDWLNNNIECYYGGIGFRK